MRSGILLLAWILMDAGCLVAGARPIPIVLDTDIGGDIDDAFALALVLASPELDLRAVTTVSGDTRARARIAAKMLQDAGRADITVAAGEPGRPLETSQASWGLGFSSAALTPRSAVEVMRAEVERGGGETVLVAIGPLSNVAAFLRRYPDQKSKIKKIVLMGGSIVRGYYPNSGPTAEYNIAADSVAARLVLASGVPIMMAPLDVTARLQLDQPARGRLFAQSKPLISDLRALYELWAKATPDLGGVPTLHDPMAVSLLINADLCSAKQLDIEIDEHGRTRVGGGKPNAVVAVETDPARFIRFYLDRVAP